MKRQAPSLFLVLVALMPTVCWADDEAKKCAPPEKLTFKIMWDNGHFAPEQGSADVAENKEITFVQSLKSAGTITWDYGDGAIDSVTSSDGVFEDKKHSYAVSGSYKVKLSAVRKCASGASSDVVERISGINVYNVNSHLEEIAICQQYENILESEIKKYDEHSLIILINLLRKERIRRGEVINIVQQAVRDLKQIQGVKNVNVKEQEINAIIQTISGAIDRVKPENEKSHLKSLKTVFESLSTAPSTTNDITILEKIIMALEKKVLARCDEMTAKAEGKLRRKGYWLVNDLHEQEKISKNDALSEKQKKDAAEQVERDKALLLAIRRTTPLTSEDLFQTYDDYRKYYFRFNVGVEFATVDKIFQKGLPRVGIAVQYRGAEHNVPDSMPASFWDAFGFYGIHTTLEALVAGSAEQDVSLSSAATPTLSLSSSPTTSNTGDQKSLGADLEVFLPIYRTARFNSRKLWGYIGPVGLIGARKADFDKNGNVMDHVDVRKYVGLMYAMNPELYTQVLYGSTASLESKRLEIRAQLPVYQFDNQTRLYLGAIGNFGIDHKRVSEADIVRVYLTWNVNFESVYEYFSGKTMRGSESQ